MPAEAPDAPPFPRTVCACADCRRGCHEQPGSLAAGELEQIAAYLSRPVSAVLAKFWASPGALVANRATGEVFRVGTITPRLAGGSPGAGGPGGGGRCVFLDGEGRCTIHAVAPYGCRMYDTHMHADEAQRRSQWLVRSQQAPAYQSLRRTLAPAASYRPTSF